MMAAVAQVWPAMRLVQHRACTTQIRLGGAKGVLSLNPLLTQSCVRLRPSQIKFETGAGPAHRALEVVTLARRVPYYLNR